MHRSPGPVVAGPGPAQRGARGGAGHTGVDQLVDGGVEDCGDYSSVAALFEMSSKSACTFPWTSMITSAWASLLRSRSFSARSLATSVRDGPLRSSSLRAVRREELAELLWPEQLPDSWTASMSAVISRLRRLFTEAGFDGAAVVASTPGAYQLHLPAGSRVDLDTLVATVADTENAAAAGDVPRARWPPRSKPKPSRRADS